MNEARLQRRALLIVGLFTAVVALLNPGAVERSERLRPSTFFVGDGGARALYEVLEQLGRPVARWMRPVDALDPRDVSVLVLLHAEEEITEPDADALLGWVARGGRLFYAPRPPGAPQETLARRLGVSVVDAAGRCRTGARAGEWALSVLEGAPTEIAGVDQVFELAGLQADGIEPLLIDDEGGSPLVRLALGAGHILMLSDTGVLTNGGLRSSRLGPVAIRALLALAPEDAVWFDEFHHGYEEGAGLFATTGRWLAGTHAGWSVIGSIVLLLATLVFAGVRFGPPLPAPPVPGRSSLEHVEALASAYQGAAARSRPARLLVEGLRQHLQLPDAAALEQRLHALGAARPDRDGDVTTILAAREGDAGSGGVPDLVALSAAIDRLLVVFADPASTTRPETSRA